MPPENAPSTIREKVRKGKWKQNERVARGKKRQTFDEQAANVRTLVDTGRMIGAVTYTVVLTANADPTTVGRANMADAMRTRPKFVKPPVVPKPRVPKPDPGMIARAGKALDKVTRAHGGSTVRRLPKIKIPKFKAPRISMPRINLPGFGGKSSGSPIGGQAPSRGGGAPGRDNRGRFQKKQR